MKKLMILLVLLVAVIGPAAAQDDPDFGTLLAAIDAAGLTETLATGGPFTVFAPTNTAFELALAELGLTADDLLADTDTLTQILLYHVVEDEFPAEAIVTVAQASGDGGFPLITLGGESVTVTLDGNTPVLNGSARVIAADNISSNGVIHAIDRVLLPPSLAPNADTPDELAEAPPTDAEDAEDVATPEAEADAAEDTDTVPIEPPSEQTILDIALATDELSTLVAAAQATGLDSALGTSSGNFTVFAPTNAAFETLLADAGLTLDDLLADRATLTNIVSYHVSEGGQTAEELTTLVSESGGQAVVDTFLGLPMPVELADGALVLNGQGVGVATADEVASNGVVHIIDGVLLPDIPLPLLDEAETGEDAEAGNAEPTPTAEALTEDTTEGDAPAGVGDPATVTMADYVASDANLSTLLAAAQSVGFTETLAADGPFMLFAPTNAAFDATLADLGLTVDDLLADPATLTDILTLHVVESASTLDDITLFVDAQGGTAEIQPLNAQPLTLSLEGDALLISGTASVTQPNISVSNGIIHVIDAVLLPASLS
jgi:transforming growth factor-beta-induced protein